MDGDEVVDSQRWSRAALGDEFDEGLLGGRVIAGVDAAADRIRQMSPADMAEQLGGVVGTDEVAVARARAAGGGTASGRAHPSHQVRTCRVCGCTDTDCSECVAKTGMPCWWVDRDLCSACVLGDTPLERLEADAGPELFGTTELAVEFEDEINWATERPTFAHNVVGHLLLWALQRWPRLATYIHDRTEPAVPRRRSARG